MKSRFSLGIGEYDCCKGENRNRNIVVKFSMNCRKELKMLFSVNCYKGLLELGENYRLCKGERWRKIKDGK
jgi:hypothetical protein